MNIDIKSVWNCFYKANWYILSGVILLNVLVSAIRVWRWVKLIDIQNYKMGFLEAFWSYLRSLYFGNVTPARVGELSRAHYLMKYVNVNSAVAVSSVVFDRVLDMYFMLILGIIGLLMSNVWTSQLWVKLVFIAMLIIMPLFVIFPDITLGFVKCFPEYRNFKERLLNWLNNFFDGIRYFLSPKILLPVILTAIIYVLFFVQCLLLAYSMGLKIDFFYLSFCVVVFSTLSVLPISVSNMGTREFVLIAMFSYIGFSKEVAVSYSLLFFVAINLTLAVLGWLTFIFYTDKEDQCCIESE
jgi:hypothetical protein